MQGLISLSPILSRRASRKLIFMFSLLFFAAKRHEIFYNGIKIEIVMTED